MRSVLRVEERRRWDTLVAEHQYLPFRGLFGKVLRYAAVLRYQWLALLGWHACVQGGSSGRVDRVVFGAAIPAAALGREQCAVRGAGSGTGPESGVSGSGIESAESGGGHRGDPRISGKDLTSLTTFIQTPSRVWVESPSVLY